MVLWFLKIQNSLKVKSFSKITKKKKNPVNVTPDQN